MIKVIGHWTVSLFALSVLVFTVACSSPDNLAGGGDGSQPGSASPDSPVGADNGDQPGVPISEGVAGRVTVAEDSPVVGALIQPKSLDEPGNPIPEIAILTEDDGRYQWALDPGRYEVSVSAEGYQTATGLVVVEAGKVTELDFTLEQAP